MTTPSLCYNPTCLELRKNYELFFCNNCWSKLNPELQKKLVDETPTNIDAEFRTWDFTVWQSDVKAAIKELNPQDEIINGIEEHIIALHQYRLGAVKNAKPALRATQYFFRDYIKEDWVDFIRVKLHFLPLMFVTNPNDFTGIENVRCDELLYLLSYSNSNLKQDVAELLACKEPFDSREIITALWVGFNLLFKAVMFNETLRD